MMLGAVSVSDTIKRCQNPDVLQCSMHVQNMHTNTTNVYAAVDMELRNLLPSHLVFDSVSLGGTLDKCHLPTIALGHVSEFGRYKLKEVHCICMCVCRGGSCADYDGSSLLLASVKRKIVIYFLF